MADFNPYRDLLNIRTSDGKPDHYALLGLPRFESDSAKISEAADARMETLQEMSISQHMDATQQLLNEVAKARRVLLDDQRRATYDEGLRNPPQASLSVKNPNPSTAPSTAPSRSSGRRDVQRSGSKRQATKTKSGGPMLPIGMTAGIAAILLAVYFAMSGGQIGSGNVIVEWAPSERTGGRILLDDQPVAYSKSSDPLYLDIPTDGRHRLTFQRDGYQDIQKTISSPKGRIRIKLNWVPQ